MKRHVIGFQIADNLGRCLHGDGDCTHLARNEVLTAAAATEFVSHHADDGYLISPVFAGDIQNYEIVSWWPRLARAA